METVTPCCRRCFGPIIGKSPASRVCTPCVLKRQRDASRNYEKRNPRTEYYKAYHLAHREEKNKKSKIYMDSMDPNLRKLRRKSWWNRNALAIKVKRELGLKTIREARAMLTKSTKSKAGEQHAN